MEKGIIFRIYYVIRMFIGVLWAIGITITGISIFYSLIKWIICGGEFVDYVEDSTLYIFPNIY